MDNFQSRPGYYFTSTTGPLTHHKVKLHFEFEHKVLAQREQSYNKILENLKTNSWMSLKNVHFLLSASLINIPTRAVMYCLDIYFL